MMLVSYLRGDLKPNLKHGDMSAITEAVVTRYRSSMVDAELRTEEMLNHASLMSTLEEESIRQFLSCLPGKTRRVREILAGDLYAFDRGGKSDSSNKLSLLKIGQLLNDHGIIDMHSKVFDVEYD